MISWQWTGERFEPCAGVPLSDRGFRLGMALFESWRVAAGESEFFGKHLVRLVSACAEREFAVEEAPLRSAEDLLRAENCSGFARLCVTAGDGTLTSAASQPRVFVFVEARELPSEDCHEITLHDEPCRPPFGGLKTANYWFNADALSHARAKRFDEALLFNDRAELIGACTANVFLAREEKLLTPPRSSGARAGVIREWVIGRRKVEEHRLRREDVTNADEIFLTNSWIGVMPVATLEGRALGRREIGPRLAAEFGRQFPSRQS